MIRPLRRAHRWLVPVVALVALAMVAVALLGRAGEPEPLPWPDAAGASPQDTPR